MRRLGVGKTSDPFGRIYPFNAAHGAKMKAALRIDRLWQMFD
jgi:hypothetical protein